MLVFTRRPGETVLFTLDANIDPMTPVGEVLSHPIQIKVDKVRTGNVVVLCEGPKTIKIVRGGCSSRRLARRRCAVLSP